MSAMLKGMRAVLRRLCPCRACSGRGQFCRTRREWLGLVERCWFCEGKGYRLFGGATR